MTIEDVRVLYGDIERKQGDFEVAHAYEDACFISVLRAIAAKEPGADPADLATEALKSLGLEFQRVCA